MISPAFIISFAVVLALSVPARAQFSCEDIFSRVTPKIKSLARLRMTLDLAQADGLSSPELLALKSEYDKKEKVLIKNFEAHGIMTRAQVIRKIRDEIEKAQATDSEGDESSDAKRAEQQKHQVQTRVISGLHVVLQPVRPGSFEVGEVGRQKPVTLTKPFSMAATPTTQMVWKAVVEAAQGRFGKEFESLKAQTPLPMSRVHPMEYVSYNEIILWISALNRLAAVNDSVIRVFFKNHRQGEIYRLPTSAEWEFVARARGKHNGDYPFPAAQFAEYAWFKQNSAHKTHAVAELKPTLVDGFEFYDMLGNVCEWTSDATDGTIGLPFGTDPHVEGTRTSTNIVRGGNFLDIDNRRIGSYRALGRTESYSGIGFRLVSVMP